MAIDLEHFPTSKTAMRMMERISPIYGRSYVGKWIFQVMGMEMDEARALFLALRDEAFPERTTWTIGDWERRYAIVPKPTETLEERRRNIRMKQSLFLPMNPARLEGIIDNMSGGETAITENVDDYTFSVSIENPGPGMDAVSIIKEIKRRKPSHQNFRFYVTLRAKNPPTLHVGGGVGTNVSIGVPQEPDRYYFRDTVHVGGEFGADTSIGVPDEPDTFLFQNTLYTGGDLSRETVLPVPVEQDKFHFQDTLHTGGRLSEHTTFRAPEDTSIPTVSADVKAGGRFSSSTILPGVEDTAQPTTTAALRAGGKFSASPSIPVVEDTAQPSLSVTVQAGGKFARETKLPVQEDTAPPPATTILRTGGVCTIISNLSKGE